MSEETMELPRLANSNGRTVHTAGIHTQQWRASGVYCVHEGWCQRASSQREREHRRQAALRVFPFALLLRSRGASVRALLTKAADYNLAALEVFWQAGVYPSPLSNRVIRSILSTTDLKKKAEQLFKSEGYFFEIMNALASWKARELVHLLEKNCLNENN